MAQGIGDLYIALSARDGKFRSAMKRGREEVRKMKPSVRETRRELHRMNAEFKNTVNRALSLRTALTTLTVGGAGFVALLKHVTTNAIEMEKWRAVTGAEVEELQVLEAVSRRYGITLEDTADFLKEIQNRAADAATGQRSYAEAFGRLGIDFRKFVQLKPTDQILALARAYENLGGSQGDAIFLMEELAGDVGARFISLLENGEKGVSELIREMRELDHVTGEENRELAELGRQLDKIYIELQTKLKKAVVDNKDEIEGLLDAVGEALPEFLDATTAAVQLLVENWKVLLALWGTAKATAFLASLPKLLALAQLVAAKPFLGPLLVGGATIGTAAAATAGGAALLASGNNPRFTQDIISGRISLADKDAGELRGIHEELIKMRERFGGGPLIDAALNLVNDARMGLFPTGSGGGGGGGTSPLGGPTALTRGEHRFAKARAEEAVLLFEGIYDGWEKMTEDFNQKVEELERESRERRYSQNRDFWQNAWEDAQDTIERIDEARQKALDAEISQWENNRRLVSESVDQLFDGVLDSLIDGTKDTAEIIANIFASLGRELIKQELRDFVVDKIIGPRPGKAFGGIASGLTPVGEVGGRPELIDFRTPSRVYSNEAFKKMLGGGTSIYVDARGATDPAAVQNAVQMGILMGQRGVEARTAFDAGKRGMLRDMVGA